MLPATSQSVGWPHFGGGGGGGGDAAYFGAFTVEGWLHFWGGGGGGVLVRVKLTLQDSSS